MVNDVRCWVLAPGHHEHTEAVAEKIVSAESVTLVEKKLTRNRKGKTPAKTADESASDHQANRTAAPVARFPHLNFKHKK